MRLPEVVPEIVSWSPRVTVLHNFLSEQECALLVKLGSPTLEQSQVADPDTGVSRFDDWRNSSSTFLTDEEEASAPIKVQADEVAAALGAPPLGLESPSLALAPLLWLPGFTTASRWRSSCCRDAAQAISERISHLTMVPTENMEPAQILRYKNGQYYHAHEDYFVDPMDRLWGQRVATVLMYLTDNVVGGETWFPHAGDGTCMCGGELKTGVCVRPDRGTAVLFWDVMPNGTDDPLSTHAGCRVLGGVKWSATKWLWSRARPVEVNATDDAVVQQVDEVDQGSDDGGGEGGNAGEGDTASEGEESRDAAEDVSEDETVAQVADDNDEAAAVDDESDNKQDF
eukprot:SM000064S19811  [mRNA]  locus=s64:581417:583907:- [translate_table: standard]